MRDTPQNVFEKCIMSKRSIGNEGETAAANHLGSKGYLIRSRNFTCRGGEIDIVAEKDGCIVFVEVKTRKNDRYGAAAEYVDRKKAAHVRRAAAEYPIHSGCDMRFDIVEVYYEERDGMFLVKEINHIEDAF